MENGEGVQQEGTTNGIGNGTSSKGQDPEYLKKLLTVAKRSIDDLKRKMAEKEKTCEAQENTISELKSKYDRVVELAKRAQSKISDMETALKQKEEESGDSDVEDDDAEGKVPVGVLIRVQQPGEDISWYLAKLANGSVEWVEERNMYIRVGDTSFPFPVPEVIYSSSDSEKLQQTITSLQEELANSVDKFRKYRIQAEMTKKKLESELETLSRSLVESKRSNVGGGEHRQSISDVSKREIERLVAKIEIQEKDLGSNKKYIAELETQRRKLQSQLDAQSTVNSNEMMLVEQYAKLKREYDNYRTHITQMIDEKNMAIEELSSNAKHAAGSSRSLDTTSSYNESGNERLSYIRNIIVQYLACKNEADKLPSMEAALATALELSGSDMAFIQKQRDATASKMSSFQFW